MNPVYGQAAIVNKNFSEIFLKGNLQYWRSISRKKVMLITDNHLIIGFQ